MLEDMFSYVVTLTLLMGEYLCDCYFMLNWVESEVPCSNHTEVGIQLMTIWCNIEQSLSLSSFHCLDMTYILLKGMQNTKSSFM